MQEKRAGVLAALIALAFAGLGGCGKDANQTVELAKKFKGQTVVVACPDARTRAIVEQESLGWSQRTGARVEVVDYDPAAEAGPSRTAADVWVILAAEVPHCVADARVVPLPESL